MLDRRKVSGGVSEENQTIGRHLRATDPIPTANDVAIVVSSRLNKKPREVRRLLTGLCHYVFSATTSGEETFVVRIATSATKHLLAGGVYWNNFLRPLGIPLPEILAADLEPSEIQFPFVILERLRGTDLCAAYQTLSDTTTKNVLVDQGRFSGIVDVDQLCFGDPLLQSALTQTALLADALDVDYIEHWMNLLKLGKQQRLIVAAYTLLFCIDFMSELGQRFNKEERPEIDPEKFARLNSIFETLAE